MALKRNISMNTDIDVNELWWSFIRTGNCSALKTLLQFGFDVNTTDKNGRNSLQFLAVMRNHNRPHFDILDMLVKEGIDIEHQCSKGYSVFDYTFLCITYAFVEKLYYIFQGSDLVFKDNYDGMTPLEAVIKVGLYYPEYPEILDYPFDYTVGDPLKLFNNGYMISKWETIREHYGYYGRGYRFRADGTPFWQKVEEFIEKGSPFDPKKFLQSYLCQVSYTNSHNMSIKIEELQCMKELNTPLNFNQMVYFEGERYGTLGHLLCQQTYGIITEKLDYLIDNGLDLTISDYEGKTVLELYIQKGIRGKYWNEVKPALKKLLPKMMETFNQQWNDRVVSIFFSHFRLPVEIGDMIVKYAHPPVY